MIGGGPPAGGGGARWASADVDASAKLNTKATAMVFMAMVFMPQRPATGFPVRKSLEEQRINIVPTRSAARRKISKSPTAKADLLPVLRKRQSVTV